MTDIQRHLKIVRKLLHTQLEQATHSDKPDLNALCTALRVALPKGYGVGSGVLTSIEGASEPSQIVIYDVSHAGGPYPDGAIRFPIETALFTLDFAFTHSSESFEALLARTASIKKLATFRQPQQRTDDNETVTQARRSIPKDRLPFSLIYFDRFIPSISWQNDILPLMQRYSATLLPDQIDIISKEIQFLNPLLDRYPANVFDLGWSRTPNLTNPKVCYICKRKFLRPHFFYDQLCVPCGDLNYSKRSQHIDLSGYRALVTGARVKIGYAVALHLLRAGAEVIITSRFPHNTAQRYSAEADFAKWNRRLHVYGLDLRQIGHLETFITHLEATYPHLDILINNAAQTVKRPPAFYAYLLPLESTPSHLLPQSTSTLLRGDLANFSHLQQSIVGQLTAGEPDPHFPAGEYDQYGEQVDNRDFNSWAMRLEDISPVELAEVHLINAIAPGILIGQLKRMLIRSPHAARFIINVSAAEGRFAQQKTGHHPHTNMAKAALNMLTRTIADEYAANGIYITSVDPGWVSDQLPRTEDRNRTAAENLPIDMTDAAARVCAPIFEAIKGNVPVYGVLLKDYRVAEW